MSGKDAKRAKRLEREAKQAAIRKQERRATQITIAIIVGAVAAAGFLIWREVNPPTDLAAEPSASPSPDPSVDPSASELPSEPAAPTTVACGAEAPATATAAKGTFEAPEQVLEDGVDYAATIVTSCGQFAVDLDEEGAPETVNSWVFLAQQGFFDGLQIFRNATSIGALQTGSGTNESSWDIGYTIADELDTAASEGYPPGTMAMANAGPATGGSQFFFVYNDLFKLDPLYARFGQVTEGLPVLEEIGAIPVAGPEGETPQELIYIDSVTVVADGEPLTREGAS